MGKYDFEEEFSGSDADNDDDFLQDEIRSLSAACMPQPSTTSAADGGGIGITNPSTAYNHSEFSDDDDDDDLELVRSIKEQYGYGDDITHPLSLKPLTTLPPVLSDDDDDDFETLRAIQKRFSQYCGGEGGGGGGGDDSDAVEINNASCADESLQNEAFSTSLGSEFLDVRQDDDGQDPCDATENLDNVENCSCSSSFPMSAQTFMEAIKKNRSYQKFIRNKMLHIEARMEEIKELQKRMKTLRDFQVQCKKKIGRALSQKQDARVLLISIPKQRANAKVSDKNVSPVLYGPLENSHVNLYKAAMENFPLLFQRDKWSKDERQALKKEIIKQFQERLFNKSADALSFLEEPGFDNGVDGMIKSITNLDITPEIIKEFSGKVDWNLLASRLKEQRYPHRSGAEYEARWFNYENCLINRDSWTSDEDKQLLLLIQKNGIHNWSHIAEKLGTNRTPFQCLARYQRSLNASILKRDWTEDEDAQLRSAVESFGESNWQAVASVLEGRTGTQCSNRWNKTLLPARQRVGKWSIDEDKRLKVAVTLFGHKSWYRIAQFVPGRTQAQCRERWVNVLDPSLNRGKWTEKDDMRLKAAIAEHGYCWSKVATCVPLRTDNQCRRRWKKLFPNEVPLLKAAKDIKKAALISNFVDRESERTALGPDDFVPLRITDSITREENNNSLQAQNKLSHGRKRVRSRKRKECDRSTECVDACSKNGYVLENKKRRTTRSESKKLKQTGIHNLATEPNNSCIVTSHPRRPPVTFTYARRRQKSRLHEETVEVTNIATMKKKNRSSKLPSEKNSLPKSNNRGGLELRTCIDGSETQSMDAAGSSKENSVRHHKKSRLHLGQSIDWEDLPLVTMTNKKRSSKMLQRNSLAKTTLVGDNNYEVELRTCIDNETHSVDAAGSNEENAVKQKESRLHLNKSLEWEDLPLAVLFRRTVTRIPKRISS